MTKIVTATAAVRLVGLGALDLDAPVRAYFPPFAVVRHRRLMFASGSRAGYSNLGYLVLGEVIAAAAGAPFEERVRT